MKRLVPFGLILSLLLVVSACGGSGDLAATATPTIIDPTNTAVPASTFIPTEIFSPPTVDKSTATTGPEAEQVADNLIAALEGAGVEHIAEIQVYTAEDDPDKLLGRPNQYTTKVAWQDDRLPELKDSGRIEVSDGGGIEVWPDQAGAQKRMDYIQSTGKSIPALAEYDFVKGPILLRVSKDLTPAQADEYKKALDAVPIP